jgi:tetratricopeptide (TPR) repeat protein
MCVDQFEKLIEKADQSAQQGDWQNTITVLKEAEAIHPDHLGVLTGMGTCLIQVNQVGQAIPYFRKVTDLAPDSAEAYNNLGVAYVFEGKFQDAEQAYKAAITVNPDHLPAWKNLANLYLQQPENITEGVKILASIVKGHPEDIVALMLLAECYEAGEEIESSITLYKKVLTIDPENQLAKSKLDQYKPLQPVLAGLDRSDLVKKLSVLKKLKEQSSPTTEGKQNQVKGIDLVPPGVKTIGIFATEGSFVYDRSAQLAKIFEEMGKEASVYSDLDPAGLKQSDLVVFLEPMQSSHYIKEVNACIQESKPFVIEVSQDYFQLPAEHPQYFRTGPGNPESLKSIEMMLGAAARILVPSKVLAERYAKFTKYIKVVEPDWDRDNPLWKKRTPARDSINIGWVGTLADRDDLFTVKKDILRILREFPEAKLMISEDLEAYKSFSAVSERRRGYLPPTTPEDLPYLLMQFDILVLPLRKTPYNEAKSNELLMAAGVRRIPWLASEIPAFLDWNAGGVVIDEKMSWHDKLAELVQNRELRLSLGEAGEQKALSLNKK